ncbi:type II secretion system F family protein [bacterium]|nr:type II secretion system F family protein [bacterium]
MAEFEYVVKNMSGVRTTNSLSAESAQAAADVLHARGLVILSLREAGQRIGMKLMDGKSFLGPKKVSGVQVALATRQLSTMLKAGLPLIRALHALASDGNEGGLSARLRSVANDVSHGETFSKALSAHPDVFSNLYVSLVHSGEESGNLGVITRQLAEYLDRSEEVKRKVKSAMAYPVLMLGFLVVVSAVIFLKIIPMMAEVYAKLGVDLPGITMAVLAVSNFAVSKLWLLGTLVAATIITWRVLNRSEQGRIFIDGLKLRMPVFGSIVRKIVTSKFLRTLGVLVESGLPIIEALNLAGRTAGNAVIAKAVSGIAESVARGGHLSEGFRAAEVFPELIVQMVATGEETGSLGEMLHEIADFYDEQSETAINTLASLIEPIMIILVGAMVMIVVVATFLPIFTMGQALRRGSS